MVIQLLSVVFFAKKVYQKYTRALEYAEPTGLGLRMRRSRLSKPYLFLQRNAFAECAQT